MTDPGPAPGAARPVLVAFAAAAVAAAAVAAVLVGTPGSGGGGDSPSGSGAGPKPRYGASFQLLDGESYADGLARTDQQLGRLDVVRVFYPGAPDPWPGKAPGRDVVVSFKIDPDDVLSGSVDDSMRAWFASAPRDVRVNWVYWHEPEDDVEAGTFTAGRFRRAFEHLDALADEAGNSRLAATVVLMSWTTRSGSGRDWRDFVPDPAHVDVLAWDVYNRRPDAGYASPQSLLGGAVEASDTVGKPFAIAELGSVLVDGDDGDGRAGWLRDIGDYARTHGASFVAYFDFLFEGAQDFRLQDSPSLDAWREISGLRP